MDNGVKPGERRAIRAHDGYGIVEYATDGAPLVVASGLSDQDARLLLIGIERVRAIADALRRYVKGDVCACEATDGKCEMCEGAAALADIDP